MARVADGLGRSQDSCGHVAFTLGLNIFARLSTSLSRLSALQSLFFEKSVNYWLCWVLVAAVVTQGLLSSCSVQASRCGGFSGCRGPALVHGAVAVARGILPGQGANVL